MTERTADTDADAEEYLHSIIGIKPIGDVPKFIIDAKDKEPEPKPKNKAEITTPYKDALQTYKEAQAMTKEEAVMRILKLEAIVADLQKQVFEIKAKE